ncbi:hypothetical protein, partial [Pseudomonas prosekii]|uniref:hypothetical protein n=1 Tax=Pseudomonas prosekii TaxID=1148509 RepID=UPI001C7CAF1F
MQNETVLLNGFENFARDLVKYRLRVDTSLGEKLAPWSDKEELLAGFERPFSNDWRHWRFMVYLSIATKANH